jgi:hypothetical protein
MAITIRKRFIPDLEGRLEFFEREGLPEYVRLRGYTSPWRKVLEAENIVLNGFYNDLIAYMQGVATVMAPNALALGYGVAPLSGVPATDRIVTALKNEWVNPSCTVNAQLNLGTAYTQATVTGLVVPMPVGTVVQFANGQTATLTTAAATGAVTLFFTAGLNGTGAVVSGANIVVGSGVTVNSWTPQRCSLTATAAAVTDPPQGTWSFYLPASANGVNIAFTEAGLLYKNSSLVPGNVAATYLATHAAFAYTKNTNTDLRIDYSLARSLT